MATINQKVGVIGAGQMGNGIAHVCALAGYDVLLNDVAKDALEPALATITGNMTRQVQRGMITEDDRSRRRWRASRPRRARRASATSIWSSRRRPRTKRSSARSSPTLPAC